MIQRQRTVALSFLFHCLVWRDSVSLGLWNRKNDGGTENIDTGDDQHQRSTNVETILKNGQSFPLVGLGVGNLFHDEIDGVIDQALRENGYRLIDTNQASHNERQVANAIENAMKDKSPQDVNNIVHVVTKIWYTHLGYERTRSAVEESLKELLLTHSNVDLRVHMLIHWPRCDDAIEWMNCEREEEDLPQSVKDVGPSPLLDKENAWKDSWKALEDMYEDPKYHVASIGVSNFNLDEMKELMSFCKVQPHVFQGYVWAAIHDPYLMNYLQEHGIVFQAYSIMNSIIQRKDVAPHAYGRLEHIGKYIPKQDGQEDLSAAQVVLAWFVQNNIAIMPRASSLEHQIANSPDSIASMPDVTTAKYNDVIRDAISALLRGEDMPSHAVSVTFINDHKDGNSIQLFWMSNDGEEIQVTQAFENREELKSFPEHVFVAYNEEKSIRREYRITADFGSSEEIHVDLTQPRATFSSNQLIHLFWSGHDGSEVPVRENLEPGEAFETTTYPGHVFVAYDESKQSRREFRVSVDYGGEEYFHVEL